MECTAKTPGETGYRYGCRCPVCRAGHATKQREYRAACRELRRLAELEEQAQAQAVADAVPPAPDVSQAPMMLDPTLDPGPIEEALNTELAAIIGGPPWKATLSALARANARIVDQAHRHQRLDVLSGVQLRFLDILDRLRRVPDAGGGVPAGVPADWSRLANPD